MKFHGSYWAAVGMDNWGTGIGSTLGIVDYWGTGISGDCSSDRVEWGVSGDWATHEVFNRGSSLYGVWSSGGVDKWCIR